MRSIPASTIVVNMSSLSSKYWNSEPLAIPASRAITLRLPAEKPRLPHSIIAASVTRSRFSGGRFHHVSAGIDEERTDDRVVTTDEISVVVGQLTHSRRGGALMATPDPWPFIHTERKALA